MAIEWSYLVTAIATVQKPSNLQTTTLIFFYIFHANHASYMIVQAERRVRMNRMYAYIFFTFFSAEI